MELLSTDCIDSRDKLTWLQHVAVAILFPRIESSLVCSIQVSQDRMELSSKNVEEFCLWLKDQGVPESFCGTFKGRSRLDWLMQLLPCVLFLYRKHD